MSNHEVLLERLYNLLPRVYRNADYNNNRQLKRYLEVLINGGLGPVYTDTKNLLNLIDFDKIPAQYLPFMASALGFTFPYDLDEQTQRTYIKNAVISYRIKGTEKALEFMVRELTRFKTTLEIDNALKKLDIRLEVDMGRQDFDKVVDKVDFLVNEYAPPFKEYILINTFLWDEGLVPLRLEEWDSITVEAPASDTSKNYGGWFLSNDYNSLTNTDAVTAFGEAYFDEVIEEVEIFTLNILDSDIYIPNLSYTTPDFKVAYLDEEDGNMEKTDSDGEIIQVESRQVDYEYEKKTWFGANNGVTNETPTYSGETYHGEIGEEYTERIIFI